MLGEISFVIIREIIKRIVEYKSIDNLINLNKRFKNLIINDKVCQKQYLYIRYPELKINCDNLKEKINVLNSKRYSYFFESGINEKQRTAVFARPSDGVFIIYHKSFFNPFIINKLEIGYIIKKILNKKLENMENVLIKENFFLFKHEISKKILLTIFSLGCETGISKECNNSLFNILNKRFENFLSEILKN